MTCSLSYSISQNYRSLYCDVLVAMNISQHLNIDHHPLQVCRHAILHLSMPAISLLDVRRSLLKVCDQLERDQDRLTTEELRELCVKVCPSRIGIFAHTF
jgi:hypothetical protein